MQECRLICSEESRAQWKAPSGHRDIQNDNIRSISYNMHKCRSDVSKNLCVPALVPLLLPNRRKETTVVPGNVGRGSLCFRVSFIQA